MKKIFLAISLFLTAMAYCGEKPRKCHERKCSDSIILEGRVSYFRPFSHTLRNMFHNGGADYSLQVTAPVWKGLNIWGAADYCSLSGKVLNFRASSHLTLVPATLGLKYIYSVNKYYGVYAGGGLKYYFVQVVNRVPHIQRVFNRNGLGGVIEIGNLICVGKHFVVDMFSSWSFKSFSAPTSLPAHVIPLALQVGGWNIGGGVGYKF